MSAVAAGMGVLLKAAEVAGPLALGVVGKVVEQVHAGIKIQAHLEFDGPGPFDANVDLSFEGRLDDGHFRIKELHITPSLPAVVERTGT